MLSANEAADSAALGAQLVEVHYTAHHNWSWVIEASLEQLYPSAAFSLRKHETHRQMPSCVGKPREKPRYALFRLEECAAGARCAWATSQVLEFLDPKDALWRELEEESASSAMPATFLLPWDCRSLDQVPELPSSPSLLKAALGSGGYGLYFVETREDVLQVMNNHAEKASSTAGFVEGLRRDYGDIPAWSLQLLVPVLRYRQQKCQFRAYVVTVGHSLYLYNTFEARLPCWDEEYEESLREDEAAFCANSFAKPYNHGRLKVKTQRVVIDEFEELKNGHSAIRETMKFAFTALRDPILSRMKHNVDLSSSISQVAIAGVDLLLDSNYKAYIVEVNNNPAMPAQGKNMTERYRQHLIELISSIFKISVNPSNTEDTKFDKLW